MISIFLKQMFKNLRKDICLVFAIYSLTMQNRIVYFICVPNFLFQKC